MFNAQTELPRYSRMVPLDEITDPSNDYNLNIPRYIDASEPEDLHDLGAHLNGGIPDTEIDALDNYWTVFPRLRNALFKANGRPGYSDSLVETQQVKTAVKKEQEALDAQVLAHYVTLTEDEIKVLVVKDKWIASIQSAIVGEVQRLTQALTARVEELEERYAQPLPALTSEVDEFSVKVEAHLQKMGLHNV